MATLRRVNVHYPGGRIDGTMLGQQRHAFRFRLLCVFVILATITAISVSSWLGSAFGSSTPAVVIKMSDKPPKFLPEKVTIKPGETVEWINNAKTLHSVDGDPSMALKPGDVSLPPG